jgi:hypothetical protein
VAILAGKFFTLSKPAFIVCFAFLQARLSFLFSGYIVELITVSSSSSTLEQIRELLLFLGNLDTNADVGEMQDDLCKKW